MGKIQQNFGSWIRLGDLVFFAIFLLAVVSCQRPDTRTTSAPSEAMGDEEVMVQLLPFEEKLRGESSPGPFSMYSGSNPSALFKGPDGDVFLVGAGKMARLRVTASSVDDALIIEDVVDIDDIETGCGTQKWAVVGGRRLGAVWLIDFETGDKTVLSLEGALSVRDIACGDEQAYVADDEAPFLFVIKETEKGPRVQIVELDRPMRYVTATSKYVITASAIAHEVSVYERGNLGELSAPPPLATKRMMTPIFGLTAREGSHSRGLNIFVGTLEQKPLDRSEGFFGNIDSYVLRLSMRLESLSAHSKDKYTLEESASRNIGLDGVITPKLLFFEGDTLWVGGYGSNFLLGFPTDLKGVGRRLDMPPGGTSLQMVGSTTLVANPLLDGVILLRRDKPYEFTSWGEDIRDNSTRIGEALFYTNMMAPNQISDAKHSRFTCETCHFEGTLDGRTHHTGRGDQHATTKNLRGVFNNRPLFTRAQDPNMSSMVHSEFRVAASGTSSPSWFSVRPNEFPWLRHLGVEEALSALELRQALLRFFFSFSPELNAHARGRDVYTEPEKRGADLFEAHCVSCHSARLQTDNSQSTVSKSEWEMHIFGKGDIMWARDGYVKTGIVPHVHPEGARPSSLRRIMRKTPYFTHGLATTLDDVLRWSSTGPLGHARPSSSDSGSFSDEDRAALLAFLLLL